MKKIKNFVIVVPLGSSGGILVLHKLGMYLEERGYNVKIFLYRDADLRHSQNFISFIFKRIKYLKIHIIRTLVYIKRKILHKKIPLELWPFYKEKILPFVSDKTIVIYPEIVFGNPLHAKRKIRWLLYHNRFPGIPDAYGKDELFFCYREYFNDYDLNPSCRLLKISHFDSSLYKQTNFGEREGVCYIVRKGKKRKDLPKIFNGPVIDDLPEEEKVAVLNKCKYCYDYDTQTFYALIACVCGCIPIVILEPGKTKLDYIGKGDCDYGKAYGNTPEEIEYAIKTRDKRLKMFDFREKNEKNVDLFLKEVEQYFG